MKAYASKLDTEKLRKVHALMQGGKTDGERQAARLKAVAIAARAGLTLTQALSKLDAPQAAAQANPFGGFGDWMEEREPGWKAQEAARRAERETQRLARCRDLLAVYGSEDAVFAPTPLEAALRDALAPMHEEGSMWDYRGFKAGQPTSEMWEAMRGAVRVPDTVPEAWAAYQAYEALTDARCAFHPDYSPHPWGDAWRAALEHLLDNLHTSTWESITARLNWMDALANREFVRDIEQDKQALAALRADIEAVAAGVRSGRAKTADRRAKVLTMLNADPALSDREIARRAGCSPQTVGNIRRRAAL